MISGGECCYGSNTAEKFEISRGEGVLVICPQKSSGLMTGEHENYLVFFSPGSIILEAGVDWKTDWTYISHIRANFPRQFRYFLQRIVDLLV